MIAEPPAGQDLVELRRRLRTLEDTQRATMNILEDFNQERAKLVSLQKATMNLLEDVHHDRVHSDDIQRALLNMLEDIETERVRAEGAKASLELVNRELESFSYSVSHDLRAPLRAISGFADAVVEDYANQLDDEGRRYLGLIQHNAHQMGQLIDDLLTFSRLNRQQMQSSEVDVGNLGQSVFAELVAQSPGREIVFTAHPMPLAFADGSLIRQVLTNLLSNAIKFTRPRPRAHIELGYVAEPAPGAYYVKDDGVGFDMQYVDKLFGVFQRLHSAAEFEGTGVGLALVHRIITRHGGRIWAEGVLNQGATFYFELPQVANEG